MGKRREATDLDDTTFQIPVTGRTVVTAIKVWKWEIRSKFDFYHII